MKDWPETPYEIASAMKAPTAEPDHQNMARKGCSSLVQYWPTRIVRMGDMQVSKKPRKTRLTQRVAKFLVKAVVVVVSPQSKIMAPKYRPIGSFCIRIELGYCQTKYPR